MSFLFGGGSKSPKDLLEQTEDKDANKRLEAVEDIGELDKQYPEIISRLEYLKDNDKEKKVRKAADKALKNAKKQPKGGTLFEDEYDDEDVPDAVTGGTAGTGFDDEVGDPSLKAGEMDVESSLSKEEEDRREMEAEGKGIFVTIKEKNRLTLSYQGEVIETGESTGVVKVANTGTANRINGIDLVLNNVNRVSSDEGIDKSTHIGMVKPGEAWKRDYQFQTDLKVIKVEQDFVDPETNLSPNFLDGRKPTFENRITITNTLDQPIANVEGIKVLNANASHVESIGDGVNFSNERMEVSEDDAVRTADVIKFVIDEIAPGTSVDMVIRLQSGLPEDTPAYKAGELSVTYDVKEFLTSGLEFGSVDGVSDIKQKIRKKQRETNPFLYDCEITFQNKSEFVYEIKEFEVRQNDINGDAIMEWLGSNASEDEREIVPGESVVFEFVYDDVDHDGNPAFGQHLEFEVQEYHAIASEFELKLPAENLKFMALEIRKAYLDENGEETMEFTIPSYVETRIPAKVWVKGIGTYPLDNVEIVEEIPDNFRFCENEEIKVFRNGEELPQGSYEVIFGSPEGPKGNVTGSQHVSEDGEVTEGEAARSAPVTKEDLAGGTRMQINLHDLKEPFAKDEELTVDYCMVAENLEPQDDPIKTYAFTEGYINEQPDSKVHDEVAAEDELRFKVVHLRDDLDIGKYVRAIIHDGENAYEIELEAENYGTSTQTLVIRDLVPSGFDLVEGSMVSEPAIEVEGPESVKDGQVYTWTFEDVSPEETIKANYKLLQSAEDANPRKLQKVYQG